jgi:ubiquinone/menaquinone biosynthesis C-methylase UbiE
LLAQRGFECVGVDLSPFGLAATAQNCRRAGIACDLIRANLCDLGCFAAAAFDAAVLVFATLGMIEGAENRLRALEEVRRLLRRRGRLIVHVHSLWPHWGSPNGRRWLMCDLVRRMARHPRAGDTHHEYRGIPNMYHHVFTKGELLRFLRAAGFAPVATVPLASRVRKGYRHGNECRGWFRHFRATGWLVVAEAR